VALSLNKLKRLGDASLTELFEEDRKLWTAMAKDAYGYTRKFIGADVRPDDVVPTLVPALEVSDRLRTYLAARKLTQNYWYTWFAELIVDRLWSDLLRQWRRRRMRTGRRGTSSIAWWRPTTRTATACACRRSATRKRLAEWRRLSAG
jgi:hypothetical protein